MNAIIAQSPVVSDVSFVAEEYYDLSKVTSSNYTTTVRQEFTNRKYICVYGVHNSKLIVQLDALSTDYTMIRFGTSYGQAQIGVGINNNFYLTFRTQEVMNTMLSKFAIGTLQ